MRKTLLLLVVLFSLAASAMSSSEAAGKIDDCIKNENQGLTQTAQPLVVDSVPYWAFYYPVSSSKKLLVIIDDETGALNGDATLLGKVGRAVYAQGILDSFIAQKSWSASTMQQIVQTSSGILQEQTSKLDSLRATTESKYPQFNLDAVQSALAMLSDRADSLNYALKDTESYGQAFDTDHDAATLDALITSYNATFVQLFITLDAYDAYSKAISAAEIQLYRSNIPDPDNANINSNLEVIRKTGLEDLNSLAKSSDPRLTLNRLLKARETWVNDSISSYEFIDAKCEAESIYAATLPSYRDVTASEKTLRTYGFGSQVDDIKKQWQAIEYFRAKRSLQAYNRVSELTPIAATAIAKLAADYKSKIQPAATATPQQKPFFDTATVVIVVLALGLAAFYYYQKKKKEENPE